MIGTPGPLPLDQHAQLIACAGAGKTEAHGVTVVAGAVPGLLHPRDEEDLVVHREPEQDREQQYQPKYGVQGDRIERVRPAAHRGLRNRRRHRDLARAPLQRDNVLAEVERPLLPPPSRRPAPRR